MSKTIVEIPYKTLQNLPKRRYMKTGREMRNIYEYEMDHKYITGLAKTGEENQYEKIQMHADECKIETILAKAAVDPTILQQRKGIFADISEMPTTMTEFMNLRIKMINGWEKLDLETKKEFNNNVDEFLAEYGSEKWMKALGLENQEEVKEVVEDTIKEPVVKEEVPNE